MVRRSRCNGASSPLPKLLSVVRGTTSPWPSRATSSLGDVLSTERGWVVGPPTCCPDGHDYSDPGWAVSAVWCTCNSRHTRYVSRIHGCSRTFRYASSKPISYLHEHWRTSHNGRTNGRTSNTKRPRRLREQARGCQTQTRGSDDEAAASIFRNTLYYSPCCGLTLSGTRLSRPVAQSAPSSPQKSSALFPLVLVPRSKPTGR
jgi:hypothetical protein